jgi:endonuclease/exonuclease/phosphatase family metal-dependent hydrolase
MFSLVVWNIQYRRVGSAEGREIRAAITACEPDIVCITEGHPDFLDMPHRIESSADFCYPARDGRRKVLLWSRQPWTAVDAVGDDSMPSGRYVAGHTETPIGGLQVHGICIPWSHAHVSHGRRDREVWQEHLLYLQGLRRILHEAPAGPVRLVAGDYNQTIPRTRAPVRAFDALTQAFPPAMRHASAGLIQPPAKPAIDHVSHDDDLELVSLQCLSNIGATGREISDHFGLHLLLRRIG